MADPRGFLKYGRQMPPRRPVSERLHDWKDVYTRPERQQTEIQAARCMDCGIPFCHQGCPLGNLIPEWNDLVFRSQWMDASDRLHATNNFPDFTGRLCPAPCEPACVLSIGDQPVTIKTIEQEIGERAFEAGWLAPKRPSRQTGRSVAVVGSGPSGLAAAQQLTRAGHRVVVFERADRAGGLLRYGIPDFKLEKWVLDRRLAQMEAEGTQFRTGIEVGVDVDAAELRSGFDAVVLAGGATMPRDLSIPGRDLDGVHQAMEYLPLANRVGAGDLDRSPLDARSKRVVVIGGGDTGADCIGTAHRQGAAQVYQLEIMPRPPEVAHPSTPWPLWPLIMRASPAHEEGGERLFALSTDSFLGDDRGRVRAIAAHEVLVSTDGGRMRFDAVPGSETSLECDMVLLALGFLGPERGGMVDQLGLSVDGRGNISRDRSWMTEAEGVFVCGDMGRGQSLIVWAIAEGRSAASACDRWLTGRSVLPSPLLPTDAPMRV
ncbi:MAG: glutamate synthase subunit beta [Actinomycetota bacterium]|nr:glutamate synthase subunit beta [Actinomycetota bacterium]